MGLVTKREQYYQQFESINDEKWIQKKLTHSRCVSIQAIWQKITEFFRPRYYQKKIESMVNSTRQLLEVDGYNQKINDFLKDYIFSLKNQFQNPTPELEFLFDLPLKNRNDAEQFVQKAHELLGQAADPIVSMLPEVMSWAEKMKEHRLLLISKVQACQGKGIKEYSGVCQLIHKVKAMCQLQIQDIKGKNQALVNCTLDLRQNLLKKSDEVIQEFENQKKQAVAPYEAFEEKIKAEIKKRESLESSCVLHEKRRIENNDELKLISETFNVLFSHLENRAKTIKVNLDTNNLSIHDLNRFKLEIEDCRNMKRKMDPVCKFLIQFRLMQWDLQSKEAIFEKIAARESVVKDPRQYIQTNFDRSLFLSKLLDHFFNKFASPEILDKETIEVLSPILEEHRVIINEKKIRLKAILDVLPAEKPKIPEKVDPEELFVKEIEALGFKVQPNKGAGHCLFYSCIDALKEIEGVDEAVQKMDHLALRKGVYAMMKEKKDDYGWMIQEQLRTGIIETAELTAGRFEGAIMTVPNELRGKYREVFLEYEKLRGQLEKMCEPYKVNPDFVAIETLWKNPQISKNGFEEEVNKLPARAKKWFEGIWNDRMRDLKQFNTLAAEKEKIIKGLSEADKKKILPILAKKNYTEFKKGLNLIPKKIAEPLNKLYLEQQKTDKSLAQMERDLNRLLYIYAIHPTKQAIMKAYGNRDLLRDADLLEVPKELWDELKVISQEKDRINNEINEWAEKEGVDIYLNAMPECDAYPEETEITAISALANVPIRVYSRLYIPENKARNYQDMGALPYERNKAIHIYRPKTFAHFEALLNRKEKEVLKPDQKI